MNEDLVREIGRVTFTPVRLREGYDMGEVDYFLDELEREVASGRSVRDRVDGKRFTPVRLREGYTMAEVDHFLDWLAQAVEARTSHPYSPGSGDGGRASTDDPATPGGHPSPPVAGPPPAPEVPSVIQEQPGLWARIFGRNR